MTLTPVGGATLVIDETDGVTTGNEVDPVGGNLGTRTVAAASLFTAAIGLARTALSGGFAVYALSITCEGCSVRASVLGDNQSIVLANNNGVIEGRVRLRRSACVYGSVDRLATSR